MRNKIEYQEEKYWSDVALRIKDRSGYNKIAGDNDPYYVYKRQVFLKHFTQLPFRQKKVLELGCGPGGNLELLYNLNPNSLIGVDISEHMLDLARKKLPQDVLLLKSNGSEIPVNSDAVEIAFSVTVLQHVTTPGMVEQLLSELARVTTDRIILCERTEKRFKGDQLNHGRPVSFYSSKLSKFGFELIDTTFLNVQISYLICGIIRRMFNNPWKAEGEPSTWINNLLQKLFIPVTRMLDPMITQERGLTIMTFKKMNLTE